MIDGERRSSAGEGSRQSQGLPAPMSLASPIGVAGPARGPRACVPIDRQGKATTPISVYQFKAIETGPRVRPHFALWGAR